MLFLTVTVEVVSFMCVYVCLSGYIQNASAASDWVRPERETADLTRMSARVKYSDNYKLEVVEDVYRYAIHAQYATHQDIIFCCRICKRDPQIIVQYSHVHCMAAMVTTTHDARHTQRDWKLKPKTQQQKNKLVVIKYYTVQVCRRYHTIQFGCVAHVCVCVRSSVCMLVSSRSLTQPYMSVYDVCVRVRATGQHSTQ